MKMIEVLQSDPSKVTLRPSGVTALLVAPTASGKTTVAAEFAAYNASRLLKLNIGESSSTIVDRHLVYTSALSHHIIVSVKPKSTFVPLPEFTGRITSQLVERLAITNKKLRMINISEIENEVEKDLERAFNKTMNTHAEYSLLAQKVIEKAIKDLIVPVASFIKSYGLDIYNYAANSLDVDEAAKNSKKMRDAIKTRLHEFIQNNLDIQSVLNSVYTHLNIALEDYFHSFFAKQDKAGDDFYFKIIDVDDLIQHKEFIVAFFSNNNVHKGSKLSIEVLCDEIVIHIPMKDTIVQNILASKKQHDNRSVYEDFSQSIISFTLIDTQGLYHEASDEDLEIDRLRHMLYNTRYDALICLTPLFGNSNDAKFQLLMSQELSKFKKNVPVFFLGNKADQYVDSLRKDHMTATEAMEDLFNDDTSESSELDVLLSVVERARETTESFTTALRERKQGLISVLPVMFKDPVNQQDKSLLDPKFSANTVINNIVKIVEDNLLQSATFIKFKYHETGWSQRPFVVDIGKLVQLLHETWLKKETYSQVRKPAIDNIDQNVGLRPHGNGFNALVVRLKRGEGWDSNIRVDYFKHHDSFHVRFPANLANLLSAEFIAELANTAVEYYGEFDDKGKKEFITSVIQFFNWGKYQFVADVLYHHTFTKAWSTNYSNTDVFNAFLKQSERIFQVDSEQFNIYGDHFPIKDYSSANTEDVQKLIVALQRQLEEALSLVFNMNVYKN